MKGELVASLAEKRRGIESGADVVVGVNRFETTEPNPLLADLDTAIMVVDPAVENAAQEAVKKWRGQRGPDAPCKAPGGPREAAGSGTKPIGAPPPRARAGAAAGGRGGG